MTEPLVVLSTPGLSSKTLPLVDSLNAGGKGLGLLRLDPQWYPATLVIPPANHAMARAGELSIGCLTDRLDIQAVLSSSAFGGKRAYVRSNARTETLNERGRFESIDVAPDLTAIERTIFDIWDTIDDPAVEMGFLIQPHLAALASGHLSNEHRVSRDATLWQVEPDGWRPNSAPQRWRVINSSPAESGPLTCTNARDIERVLRSIARWFSDMPTRYHLEWVWDGSRVWIVQADAVARVVGPAPGDAWEPTVGRDVDATELIVWRELQPGVMGDDEVEGWPKANAVFDFEAVNLPTATLWRLSGSEVVESLADNRDVGGLASDLELLCSGHIVIRTDIRSQELDVMAPKTGTVLKPAFAEQWLRETSARLLEKGLASDSISFLAHRFLRARASAWTLAQPGNTYVEVDSMWGTPDGLAWLPHDSAWVQTTTGEVRRSIEGKPDFLDIDEQEDWTYRESPTEWIWRASMTDDQLRTVAVGSQRLADYRGRPTLTMWFIDMLGGRGADCLPWVRMDAPEHLDDESRAIVSPQNKRVSIRSASDLDALAIAGRTDAEPLVMRLSPGADLVRDKKFLDRVAEIAIETGSTVELVGSSLAHPFYMLRRAGVTVAVVGRFDQPELDFNKLVRDNIVEQIADRGEKVVSYIAKGTEYTRLLRLKVAEEALELLAQPDREGSVLEMADVLEVVDALRRALGVTRDELRGAQKTKRDRRGGFEQGSVLVSTGGHRPTTDESAPTLFEDDPSLYRPYQVQQHRDRIVLSLVPPLETEQHRFRLEASECEVLVDYGREAVEIRILPKPQAAADSDQALF